MKKGEIIDAVKYNLKTINETLRYGNELIEVIISPIYDDLMYRLYKNTDAVDLYVKEYEKGVLEDTNGDYYIQLDVYPIQLKNQAGVYYVKTKGYNGIMGQRLAQCSSIEVDIFDNLGINTVDEKGTYYVQGDKVYLQMYGDLAEINTVKVGVIRQFKDYAYTEEVYLPKQAGSTLIDQAVAKLSAKPMIDDMINDNSDNIEANVSN